MKESLLYKRALVSMVQLTTPDIAEKIDRLFSGMKNTESCDVIAKEINDILIYGDKVPLSLLKSAWNYFAQRKGIEI